MSRIRRAVRRMVESFGYTYSLARQPLEGGFTFRMARLTQEDKTGVRDLVGEVCRKYNVPFCATVEQPTDYPEAAPLFPVKTKAVLPTQPLKHYASLQEAVVNNVTMPLYFKVEVEGGNLFLTDQPVYVLRQKMICAGLSSTLGVRNLAGLRVLDIGCSCGYFSFAAEQMGAREVWGIEARPEHLDQCAILSAMLPDSKACRFRALDMENEMEQLTEPFDVVFSMGVMYHVFDHVRFARNLYRLTRRALYLAGACSGHPGMMCEAVIEDKKNLRASIHGPVLFPSVAWMVEVLRWVGFNKVYYQRWPAFQEDKAGCNRLHSATLVAVK